MKQHVGTARQDWEGPTETDILGASCAHPKTLLNPNTCEKFPVEISLHPYTCARARSIITVNSCPIHCQHVADGQELSAHLGVSNTPGSAVCQQKYLGMAGGSCAATEWFRVCDDFPHCPCSHSLVKEHFIHLWWMSLCCRINLLIPIFALHWELNQWYKKIILRISIRVSSPSFTPYNFLLLHGFVDPFLWGLEVSTDLLRVTGHGGCQWDEGIHNHRDAGLKLI